MTRQKFRRRARIDWTNVVAALVVLAILASIFGLAWWVRASAPCAAFTVATAPVRCLPGGEG